MRSLPPSKVMAVTVNGLPILEAIAQAKTKKGKQPPIHFSEAFEVEIYANKLGYGSGSEWITSVPSSEERARQVAVAMLQSAMEFTSTFPDDVPPNLGKPMGDMDKFLEDL